MNHLSWITSLEYGAKAYNLGRLMQMGCRVPSGFALTPEDVRCSGLTRRLMAYRGMMMAVRSSALGEDGKDTSFAGQHDTVLDVLCNPYNIWKAIDKVRNSVNDSLDYQKAHDAPVTQMGVIIQKMISPRISGVMFTSDPTTGEYGTKLIEYVEGLGDKLVGGSVNPDGRVRVKSNGQFEVEIKHPLEWNGSELVYLGDKIADKFNEGPLDIEWALDKWGAFHILQARPITGVQWNIKGEGKTAYKGRVEGFGRWVHGAHDEKESTGEFQEGDILLTRMTDPKMINEMILSKGMATMIGGQTCHAAIVARELGKPCVIGAGEIVKAFVGQDMVIDADEGALHVAGG